jgi:hypothetical protein
MPRKEYKTITVKSIAFRQFTNAVKMAKKRDPDIDNTTFLTSLVSKSSNAKRKRK